MKYISLSDIRTSFILLGALDPRFEKHETNELSMEDRIDLLPPLDGTLTDFGRYGIYKEFIDYAFYAEYCGAQLSELRGILQQKADLEQPKVRAWINHNNQVFLDNIFSLFQELEKDFAPQKSNEEYFHIEKTEEYLEKREFQSVISFYSVMNILHFKEYYKIPEDRNIDLKCYPEAEDQPDLKIILSILKL